ncbi:MAG: AN1-type zinc finger domain-containing protein [Candidatus Bathyarchaeia archaeon]
MPRCEYCRLEINLPFRCRHCGKALCVDHRLPENHECKSLLYKRGGDTVSFRELGLKEGLSTAGKLHFSRELRDLIIAWLVLGFCFSINVALNPGRFHDLSSLSVYGVRVFFNAFLISLLTVGLGFVAHELSHRYYGRKLGCHAEFKLWPLGLLMALAFALLSRGSVVFAAPGAVYISPKTPYMANKRMYGIISLAGPLANLAVALMFLTLSITRVTLLSDIGEIGFVVNLWLAAFNLLPLGMMDGQKIYTWDRRIWFLVTIPVWVVVFLKLL